MVLSLSGCGAGKARQSGSSLLFALPKRAGQKNKGRCFLRSSIRKQIRKLLTARRHLPRYRALHSTKECRGGAATKAPVGLSNGQTGLRSAQMPSVVFGRQGCSPLPCICRHAAILRCFAVLAEPLFSYVARALCGACRIKRLAYLPSMTSRVSRAIISSSLVSMTRVRTRAPQAVISTTSDFCL